MPQVSSVHVDKALTNLAIATPATGFLAPRLLPDLPVEKVSDLFYKFDAGRRNIAEPDDMRAPGTEANRSDYEVTTDSYICTGHALSGVIPDEEKENADSPIQPVRDKVEHLVEKLLTKQDIRAKAIIDAGIPGSDPTHEWDDYTNGDPFADFKLAINTVEDATGKTPNICAMDTKVWRALKDHPDLVDRVKYTGGNSNPGEVTRQALAELFELDEVIIGSAQKNTAIQNQTASLARIWGSDVYVAFRPSRPGLKIPAFGYRMVWRPFSGARSGFMVKRWREEKKTADMVEVSKYYVHKLTLVGAGYRLQNRLT